MLSRSSAWLLLVLVVVGVPFWWLLIDPDRSPAPAKPVHIAELRTLAAIMPGRRPSAIACTVLATRKTVGDYYAAGIGLKRRPLALVGWTLPVPGQGPILIDPTAPPATAGFGAFGNGDRAAQTHIAAEARTASLVLSTQGPLDDVSGAPRRIGGGKTSRAQPAPVRPTYPAPISYTTAQAVAPGVVIIPATGQAPDSRLIFVQLADGREFLFAGAVATFTENWAALRARSHLAAAWGPAQNRSETYAWLRTIRQLRREAPDLHIVPGHDYVWLTSRRTSGAILDGLAPVQPARAP